MVIETEGLKIAENEEEAFWTQTKKKIEQEIQQAERAIEMDKHLLPFIDEKLKGCVNKE